MKFRSTSDYIFTRRPGEIESYDVAIYALDDDSRMLSCGTVGRRPGSPTMWDISHESDDVKLIDSMPKEIEAATFDEMQKEYRARFKIGMVSPNSDDDDIEYMRACEGVIKNLFRMASIHEGEMKVFVAIINGIGDFLATQGPPEQDKERTAKIADLLVERMGEARARMEFRDAIREAVKAASDMMEEAQRDSDDGEKCSSTAPTMQ